MPKPPTIEIDPKAFWRDPYPTLAMMREQVPIAFVPQLNAILMTKRDDIFVCEKNIDVFSSYQPYGLMTQLMGENMMRRDGAAHQEQRRQAFPSLSPITVRDHWRTRFQQYTNEILRDLGSREAFDLVRDFAMPVSANALREITGLLSMSAQEMDAVSQAMIDGCANYAGDPDTEARCKEATGRIDAAIDKHLADVAEQGDFSMISILSQAGQELASIRANIKLAISGGQNEPRDAIAGLTWALLTQPSQYQRITDGQATWLQAFEEYARWISPIGMSPRRIAKAFTYEGVDFEPEQRLFFMFGSANRDESIFADADTFDVCRNNNKAVSFGAGPHFCAGAAASRCLIADVAMPTLFQSLPTLTLDGDVPFGGWAFRGPLAMPVKIAS